ncbi:MAG: hypothetical protein IJ171_01640 [Ruminococcus sp.]|nr:hypothetical protein [Ruminococcus sp.]
MMDLDECLEKVQAELTAQEISQKELDACFRENDYISLPAAAEKCLRHASGIYLLYRELLLSLCELIPSARQTTNEQAICCEMLNISVVRMEEWDFPCYKIGLPFLLPNKRKRNAERNCIITDSVGVAVRRFCGENHIMPFAHATVIFLPHYQRGGVTVDADTVDSSLGLNLLIGKFIRDDRPEVCNTIYYSKVSEKSITEIFVVDSDHDVEVLSSIKSTCHN